MGRSVRRAVMIVDAIRDLYVARWGEPSRNARFHVDGLDVEVFKWTAETNPEGVNLYATIGASVRPMAGRDPNHRLEFFVGLLPAKDDIASPLAALALYSTREGVVLDHGHTVSADGPLWSGSEMHRFLVLLPLVDIVALFELPDGLHIEFLQAIPVYDIEATYKTEHGAEALLQRWERSQVPFWESGPYAGAQPLVSPLARVLSRALVTRVWPAATDPPPRRLAYWPGMV